MGRARKKKEDTCALSAGYSVLDSYSLSRYRCRRLFLDSSFSSKRRWTVPACNNCTTATRTDECPVSISWEISSRDFSPVIKLARIFGFSLLRADMNESGLLDRLDLYRNLVGESLGPCGCTRFMQQNANILPSIGFVDYGDAIGVVDGS
jgi:hypothetical protein